MTQLSLDDDAKMVCPSCKARQAESAKYYVVLNEYGASSLCKERCSECITEFKAWRDVDGLVEVDIIKELVVVEPISLKERLSTFIGGIKWYHPVGVVALVLTLWLQPWETPKAKVADEWVECNTKYAGKCTYAGTRYRTGSLEMYLSEFFHGNISDKKLDKLRYPNGH